MTVLSAGINGPVTFSYTITDAAGVSDSAFVTFDPLAVDGTAGNDSMLVGFRDAQQNQIDGADGMAEAIYGYGGNDKIFAGEGDDRVYGGQGNDFVRAGAGDDMIQGAEGGDVLDGGSGADTMEGGAGNDVYYIDNAGDVVIEAANSGYDKLLTAIDASGPLLATIEELWLRPQSAAIEGRGNDLDNKIIGNELSNRLWGAAGADKMIAGLGDDSVYGDAGRDVLYGEAGNDSLDGGADADKLYGGAGEDILSGGAGADTLAAGAGGGEIVGGLGNDLMAGGAGADDFFFALGSGSDRLRNFDATEDRLVFTGLTADDLTVTTRGAQTVLTWGVNDKLVIKGWVADLSAGDLPFDFL